MDCSKELYFSRDSEQLIALMAHHVLREMLHDVQEAEVFAIIVDEATDISNAQQLCLSVRWVDNAFMIHEAPVETIKVPKTDAATFDDQGFTNSFLLPLSQCQGQSYDGASNMSGHIIIWSCCQYTKGGRISHLCPLFGTLYKSLSANYRKPVGAYP